MQVGSDRVVGAGDVGMGEDVGSSKSLTPDTDELWLLLGKASKVGSSGDELACCCCCC